LQNIVSCIGLSPSGGEPRATQTKLTMGWLRLVGSLKLQVSFVEYRLFYRSLLQKRPIILRSQLIVATPYQSKQTHKRGQLTVSQRGCTACNAKATDYQTKKTHERGHWQSPTSTPPPLLHNQTQLRLRLFRGRVVDDLFGALCLLLVYRAVSRQCAAGCYGGAETSVVLCAAVLLVCVYVYMYVFIFICVCVCVCVCVCMCVFVCMSVCVCVCVHENICGNLC